MHVPSSFYIVYDAPTVPKGLHLKHACWMTAGAKIRRLDPDEDGLGVAASAAFSFGQGVFESMELRVPGGDYHETWLPWISESTRGPGSSNTWTRSLGNR
jgi:hypothetical protein